MTIIGLLVVLIVIGLVWWAINALLGAFGIGNPIATVVKVLFVVIVILWLISALGYGTGLPRLR
jgi:hypothetical protein